LRLSVVTAAANAGAASTSRTNVVQWRFWKQFCDLMGTEAISTDRASNSAPTKPVSTAKSRSSAASSSGGTRT
jgi:hypothetical protein